MYSVEEDPCGADVQAIFDAANLLFSTPAAYGGEVIDSSDGKRYVVTTSVSDGEGVTMEQSLTFDERGRMVGGTELTLVDSNDPATEGDIVAKRRKISGTPDIGLISMRAYGLDEDVRARILARRANNARKIAAALHHGEF